MIKDALDDNSDKIIDNFYFDKAGPNGNKGSGPEGSGNSAVAQRVAIALAIVKDRMVQVFPDEVKAPYIAITVNNHVETMPIKSQIFEDWMGSSYYEYFKQQELERLRRQKGLEDPHFGEEQIDEDIQHEQHHLVGDVLSADDMSKIQSCDTNQTRFQPKSST